MEWLLIGFLMWSSPTSQGFETVQWVDTPRSIAVEYATQEDCERSARMIWKKIEKLNDIRYKVGNEIDRHVGQIISERYSYVNQFEPVCIKKLPS